MIHEVSIDGVRTLSGFNMAFREGLNVLVGPNGAGKTNILVALDFLSSLAHFRLDRAFARQGGLGSVATWPSARGRYRPITIVVKGAISLGSHSGGAHRHPKPSKNVRFHYSYGIHIEIDPSDIGTITKEVLQFSRVPMRGSPRPVLEIRRANDSFSVTHLDMKRLEGIEWFPSGDAFLGAIRRRGRYFSDDSPLIPSLEALSYLVHMMTHEFQHLERVNIAPESLRGGDPVGTSPTIQPSGRGLVRTLAALRNDECETNSDLSARAAFDRILNRARTGVEGIRHLSFHRDMDTARYLAQATVACGNKTRRVIPLGRLSDGTLKWLALLTQIETSDLFAIEEPENYLHPTMQREAVRFLREYATRNDEPRAVVVTTHSETIISALGPEELIVVRDVGGRTVASRLRNPESIVAALNETGFGLGHIYLSGDLFDPASLVSAGTLS